MSIDSSDSWSCIVLLLCWSLTFIVFLRFCKCVSLRFDLFFLRDWKADRRAGRTHGFPQTIALVVHCLSTG